MGSDAEAIQAIHAALSRAAIDRRRALRASQIADRHDRQARAASPSLVEFHSTLADLHRGVAARHIAAARAHLAYAARVRKSVGGFRREDTLSLYMAGVADSVHAQGASVLYLEKRFGHALRVGSGPTAKAAQDLETIVGEGPSLEAFTADEVITAAGAEMNTRWPLYGPAAARLGVTSVVSLPVPGAKEGTALGALTLYQPHRCVNDPEMRRLRAAANCMIAFLVGDQAAGTDDPTLSWQRAYSAQLALVHQVAGMLAVREGCSVQDALAVIAARAFADGIPAEEAAAALSERLQSDGPR